MSHDSADTRPTAYVFGELSEDQLRAFEKELAQSNQLRDEVAAVKEAVAAIRAELDAETTGVDETRRKEIEQAIGNASLAAPAINVSPSLGARRLMAMTALAASVLIVCGLVYTNLPQDRELSMNDEHSPAAATIADATDSIAPARIPEDAEKLAMKGGYAGNGEKPLQRTPTEELARGVDRQLGRSSQLPPQDETMFSGGIEVGKGGMKSAPAELAQQKVSQPSPGGGQQVAEPYGLDADASDARLKESAPLPAEPSRSDSYREAGERRSSQAADPRPRPAAARGGAAGPPSAGAATSTPRIMVESEQLMVESEQQQDSGAAPRSADEAPHPFGDSAPDDLQLMVRPQVIVNEELGEGIASKQPSPRRRSRRSSEQIMEMDEMSLGYAGGYGLAPEVEARPMGGGANEASSRGLDIAAAGGAMNMGMSDMMTDSMDMQMGMGMGGMGGMGAGMAGDRYEPIEDNPFTEVNVAPLSTFSVDVDTAAYAKIRMYLMQQNTLPRPAAVRIEELVNYFHYDYTPPSDEHPFAAAMDVAECPWNPAHRLARIGIKGKVIEEQRPPSNLVFLLDVSGSMNRPNKLPLVIEGMTMLADQLTENDAVAIVVYAGQAGMVLDSTSGDQKQTIISSLERLRAGGSTDGGSGIKLAYDIARDHFIVGGTNRVLLCTDGDFNVGVTGTDELVRIAEENAKSNVYLSILGFGMGNHNDAMMEQVSNKANGNYAFIDSKAEAYKVLVEELGATLVTIAKNVKIQVEFNPVQIESYRLIGYENRIMAAQDFKDDTKDAGEIGAGHTVTAFYELVPRGAESNVTIPPVDDLRYQKKARLSKAAASGEALTLKLRYKMPDARLEDESTLIQFPVIDDGKKFSEMDEDFQFASAVASFGMLLRKSLHKGDATFAAVHEIAAASAQKDASGYRAEFLKMVARAKELSGE